MARIIITDLSSKTPSMDNEKGSYRPERLAGTLKACVETRTLIIVEDLQGIHYLMLDAETQSRGRNFKTHNSNSKRWTISPSTNTKRKP